MLLEIQNNQYINTKHVLLLKISQHRDGKRFLVIEFINGIIVKYPETTAYPLEKTIQCIVQNI